MPLEERYITFDLPEIYQSVQMRCIREELEMPPKGTPLKLEMDGDDTSDHAPIFLHLKTESGTEKIEYERTFFALGLVFFCQGSGIPLPAKGKKTLKILEDKIIMKIDLLSNAK
ncbi:MAG: hypothetical protein LRZ85_09910 [Alphaproteobacteria bacterium]|nr:hypothetical protein [Alphaproteobacteria bacterium]MCD8525759.1 hypothetical protein [Alphaproteobacteria bacterium]MCD8571138.1 hypothetical protein [Alphaproteobacteria bacterium]